MNHRSVTASIACSAVFCAFFAAFSGCASTAPADRADATASKVAAPATDAEVRASCIETARGANVAEYKKIVVAKGIGPAFAAADAAFMAERMEPMFGRLCGCAADAVGGWQAYAKDPTKAEASMAKSCQEQAVAGVAAELPTPAEHTSFTARWAAAHPTEAVATSSVKVPASMSAPELEAARLGCGAAIRQPNEVKWKKRAVSSGSSDAFATAQAAFVMSRLEPVFVTMCDCLAQGAGGWGAFVRQPPDALMATPAAQACSETVMASMASAMPSKETMLAFREQWIAEHPGVSATSTPAP